MRRSVVAGTVLVAAALAVGLGAIVAARASSDEPPFPDLSGRSFEIERITDGGRVQPGPPFELVFGASGLGHAGGTGGCNGQTFSWKVNAERQLVAEVTGMTMMACDEARMAVDTSIKRMLESRPAVELDGSTLTLRHAAVEWTGHELAVPLAP